MDPDDSPLSRRRLLGLVGTTGAVALAGCNGNSTATPPPSGGNGGSTSTQTGTGAGTPTATPVPEVSMSLSVEGNRDVQIQPEMPGATVQEHGVQLGIQVEVGGPPLDALELVANEGTADSIRIPLLAELGTQDSYDTTYVVDPAVLLTGDNTFRLVATVLEQTFESGRVSATVRMPRGWRLDVKATESYAGIDTAYDNELVHDDFPAEGDWTNPPIHDDDFRTLAFDDVEAEVTSRLSEDALERARNATLGGFARDVLPVIHKLASANNDTSGAVPSQAPRVCVSLELAYQALTGNEATGFAWESPEINRDVSAIRYRGSYAMRDHATEEVLLFQLNSYSSWAPRDSPWSDTGDSNHKLWHPMLRAYEAPVDQRALEDSGARDGYVTGKRATEDMLEAIGSNDVVGEDDEEADGYMVDAYETRVRDMLATGEVRRGTFRKISNQMKLYKAVKGAVPSSARVVVGSDSEGSLDSFTIWVENPRQAVGFNRLVDRGLLRSSVQLDNETIEQRLTT